MTAAAAPSRRRGLRSLMLAGSVALSLASSALAVAMTLSEAVFEAVSTAVRVTTGLATVAAQPLVRYRGAARPLREAVEDTSRRVSARVARGAARSVGAAAGEAVPVAGVAVVAAATAWDLYDACETMRDLRALEAALDPAGAADADAVCGIAPPSVADLSAALVGSAEAAVSAAWTALGGDAPPPAAAPPAPRGSAP